MKEFLEKLKSFNAEKVSRMVRDPKAKFPEGHLVFVKRDMYGDSEFAHVIIPNKLEDVVAFFAIDKDRLGTYELRVKEHGPALVVEKYFDDEKLGHWVVGFLYRGKVEGMALPWAYRPTEEDHTRAAGYVGTRIRALPKGSRCENPVDLWVKAQ